MTGDEWWVPLLVIAGTIALCCLIGRLCWMSAGRALNRWAQENGGPLPPIKSSAPAISPDEVRRIGDEVHRRLKAGPVAAGSEDAFPSLARGLQKLDSHMKWNQPRDRGEMARSADEYKAHMPRLEQRSRTPHDEVSRVDEACREFTQAVGVSTHELECPTGHAVPVPVRTGGLDEELVAWLCTDCDAQLPADWRDG